MPNKSKENADQERIDNDRRNKEIQLAKNLDKARDAVIADTSLPPSLRDYFIALRAFEQKS